MLAARSCFIAHCPQFEHSGDSKMQFPPTMCNRTPCAQVHELSYSHAWRAQCYTYYVRSNIIYREELVYSSESGEIERK